MTKEQIIQALRMNASLREAVAKLYGKREPQGIVRFPKNATFRYMRVKPAPMAKTPAYSTNIWKRMEYFKPIGKGCTK